MGTTTTLITMLRQSIYPLSPSFFERQGGEGKRQQPYCDVRRIRIKSYSYEWLMTLLIVVICCSEYCTSRLHHHENQHHQHQQTQHQKQHQQYQMHNVHAGVKRDYQNLLLQQDQRVVAGFHQRYDGTIDTVSIGNNNGNQYESNTIGSTVGNRMALPGNNNPKEQYPNRLLQDERDFCYEALSLADANDDFQVDRDEFVTFAQIMGPPGFLTNTDTYQDLPLILQSNFIILTCLCLQMPSFDGGTEIDPQCCNTNPHLDVNGTYPGQIPTYQQEQYLYQVCFLTETSIERLLISQTPSAVPTDPPTPSRSPTKSPTPEPTQEPTRMPSQNPTRRPPTRSPTVEPSQKPSREPSKKPSRTPSNEPTENPSYQPTTKPSSRPTKTPTNKPTEEPSNKFTDEPTEMITDNRPTENPSKKLSNTPTMKPTNFFPLPVQTKFPTDTPTITDEPTEELTSKPTDKYTSIHPTLTEEPTSKPTEANMSLDPTLTEQPTEDMTDDVETTSEPTGEPIVDLSEAPSVYPTTIRSAKPTVKDNDATSAPFEEKSSPPSPYDDTTTTIQGVTVDYGISIKDGKNTNIPSISYVPDLIQSMNMLAPEVAESINSSSNSGTTNRQLRSKNKRRLQSSSIEVEIPTSVDGTTFMECPSFVSSENECKTATASMKLKIITGGSSTDDDAAIGIKDLFEKNLNTAIENGELQDKLNQVNPDSVVSVITGSPAPVPNLISLSPGGIAGIVLAGVGGLIIGLLVVGAARRRGLEEAGGANPDGNFAQDVEEAEIQRSGLQDSAVTNIIGDKYGGGDDSNKGDGGRIVQTPSSIDVPSPLPVDTVTPNANVGGAVGVVATATAGTAAGVAIAGTTSSENSEHQNLSATCSSARGSSGSPSKKKRPSSSLYEVPGAKGMVSDEASSAGESGWSSNQDGSSIDNSLDSIPAYSGASPVVLAAAVGTAIAASTSVQNETTTIEYEDPSLTLTSTPTILFSSTEPREQTSSTPQSLSPQSCASQHSFGHSFAGTENSIHSTYSELDDAIQKGDWAAVGVTAALLASQAYVDDSTQDSSKKSGSNKLGKQKPPLNPERAAELDLLVENGDWEGVVAAAAKFDAQEALHDAQSSQNSESGSVLSSANGSNTSSFVSGSGAGSSTGTTPSGSQTIDTTTSPSTYTATGLTATSDTVSTRSKARKLNEIRGEVEALVVAVVPEEADNVDEMMTQFRGREEELVETLRSMQERQVAQKARKESQKYAKRQAKAYVEDKKNQKAYETIDNVGTPIDDIWMKDIENTDENKISKLEARKTEFDEEEEAKVMKEQLKEAIDDKNWQNVAEAAAGLSGHAYVHEKNDDDNVAQSTYDDSMTSSNRSYEINTLVDTGDWDGVVAADSNTIEDTEGEITGDSTIEKRRKRREGRLKEEEEALAQAEIWNTIADQTKVDEKLEVDGNAGAAQMAADWAIDQSLAALRKAEEDDHGSNDSELETKDDSDADVESM